MDYDPETGIMRWRVSGKGIRLGDVAGGMRVDGRWTICIDRGQYLRSRLAYLHFYGKWPEGDIDHKNMIKDDDRIENLREATRSKNCANVPKKSTNTTGFKGVWYDKSKRKWAAEIRYGVNKRKRLGRYDSPEKAYEVYCRAAEELHAEFART
jgi:hypothetical protein